MHLYFNLDEKHRTWQGLKVLHQILKILYMTSDVSDVLSQNYEKKFTLNNQKSNLN